MRLDEAISVIVDALTAAGIRATAELADLNTPACYVVCDAVEFDGLATYTWRGFIYAIAADTGRMQSYKQLGPLVEQVQHVMPSWGLIQYVDIATPGSADPLPAYRMPTAIAVTITD